MTEPGESIDPDGRRRLTLTRLQAPRFSAMHMEGIPSKEALERLGIDRDKYDEIVPVENAYIDDEGGDA